MGDHNYQLPPRRSPQLLIALALLVVGLAMALLLVLTLRDAIDPLARAEREAAHWRAERLDDQLFPLDLAIAEVAVDGADRQVVALGVGLAARLQLRRAGVDAGRERGEDEEAEADRAEALHVTHPP